MRTKNEMVINAATCSACGAALDECECLTENEQAEVLDLEAARQSYDPVLVNRRKQLTANQRSLEAGVEETLRERWGEHYV